MSAILMDFYDEKFKLKWDATFFECAKCTLDIKERLNRCFFWCYDQVCINQENRSQTIAIYNAVSFQKRAQKICDSILTENN